jgi:hypothetical protein
MGVAADQAFRPVRFVCNGSSCINSTYYRLQCLSTAEDPSPDQLCQKRPSVLCIHVSEEWMASYLRHPQCPLGITLSQIQRL